MTTNKPEVKRYDITTDKHHHPVPYEAEHGQWVKYSSYEALQAEYEKLRADNALLIEDRARFPDRPDFIGYMISAHLGNLKAGKEQAEKYALKWCNEAEKLRAVLDAHKAARVAYASEFPLGADGTPDVGSIHENIRLLKKDAEQLDWIVSEGAIVAHAGVRGEPYRYRVEWPLLGEAGINWFASERDAIDDAMQRGES